MPWYIFFTIDLVDEKRKQPFSKVKILQSVQVSRHTAVFAHPSCSLHRHKGAQHHLKALGTFQQPGSCEETHVVFALDQNPLPPKGLQFLLICPFTKKLCSFMCSFPISQLRMFHCSRLARTTRCDLAWLEVLFAWHTEFGVSLE